MSILGYCDDLTLMSPSYKHMYELLEVCDRFTLTWKLEFNGKKSIAGHFGEKTDGCVDFFIDGERIPNVKAFIHLGLPIGNVKDVFNFFDDKIKKVERSFYSLYSIGCRPGHLSPYNIAFIFKQFCQSIFRYGLECLYLPAYKLKEFDIRQNILLKNSIGLSKFCRTTPLFNVLKIERIEELYLKHKLYFYKQIENYKLTKDVINYLTKYYIDKTPHKGLHRSNLE